MCRFSIVALTLLAAAAAAGVPVHHPVPDVIPINVRNQSESEWRDEAIRKLWKERDEMGHTPLMKLAVPGVENVFEMWIKNETASASGTLKHRFVWALALWAVVEGKITSKTIVYDSTSGNTGASEAYMCRLIGVRYVAVVANELEQEKMNQITQFGGEVRKVNVAERNYWAQKWADENGGFFINQFGNADAAEEYHESGNFDRESTNVFHEIVQQLKQNNRTYPDFFVHSAGTGGTISSVGKYISRYAIPTKVVLADSQHSLFYGYVLNGLYTNTSAGDQNRPKWVSPGIAGIGYGYNTAPVIFKNTTSLVRTVIDQVARMPDIATVAAMRVMKEVMGVDVGASTALNFLVSLYKAILYKNETGDKGPMKTTVFIMGDPGRFYTSTYFNDTWVDKVFVNGMTNLRCWQDAIQEAVRDGGDLFEEKSEACDF